MQQDYGSENVLGLSFANLSLVFLACWRFHTSMQVWRMSVQCTKLATELSGACRQTKPQLT